MSQLESAVEAHLIRSVLSAGALTFKLAPTTAGVPDRLVVWPTGRVDFVEVKAEGGRLSSIQKVRIRDLEANAANVFVVTGKAEVDAYVAEAAAEGAAQPRHRVSAGSSWD